MSERPRALVGVLRTARVVPGIEVRVGCGFLKLVREDRDRSVDTGVAVRTNGLSRTGSDAPRRVAHEGISNVTCRHVAGSMPSAVPRAETRGLGDVRGGDDEIDALSVVRQLART